MTTPDLSVIPDFSLAQDLLADVQDLTTQNISFPFCVLFDGRPWGTLVVAAPSPEAAALTMDQIVQRANAALVARRYPPNVCSWILGACQF